LASRAPQGWGKFDRPSPAGWTGGLNDMILDASVLPHDAGQNNVRQGDFGGIKNPPPDFVCSVADKPRKLIHRPTKRRMVQFFTLIQRSVRQNTSHKLWASSGGLTKRIHPAERRMPPVLHLDRAFIAPCPDAVAVLRGRTRCQGPGYRSSRRKSRIS
jgi:hypothetical protein